MSFKRYEGKIAGSYDLEETIGKGHFAVVKLARHVYSGEKVAVKVIDKTKLDDVSKAHLFQEVGCMKLVQHPNVVRLYEVIDTPSKLYLIMELGDGGDMYDFITRHDHGLEEEMARRFFRQIVHAINYCHQLHVVHRDLKLENVVIFEKLGIVKLTDFGFSNKFIPGRQLDTSCGSLAYSAPEILLGDAYDAPAVDVWSLGVILYMLVVGELPFHEANDSETLTMIMDCRYTIPNHVSTECKLLLGRMLVRDPKNRTSLSDIMNHHWLTRGDPAPLPLLPLISWEHLTQDEHSLIISKMVARKLASKDDILQALERNAYNHVTATYYLLAESRLRKQREKQAHVAVATRHSRHHKSPQHDPKLKLAPLSLTPRGKSADRCKSDSSSSSASSPASPVSTPVSSAAARRNATPTDRATPNRKFSLIQEEVFLEEEEMEVDENQSQNTIQTSGQSRDVTQPKDMGHDVKRQSCFEESLSDDSDTRSNHSNGGFDKDLSIKPSAPRRPMPVRPLHSVRSSPQLLNQIFEEGESEEEDLIPVVLSTQTLSRNIHQSPEILRKYDARRKRLSKGQRGSSYSSSDTSDTDDTETRRRRDKFKGRMHRRDSSEHSSDTDGGPTGLGGGAGRLFGSSTTSTGSARGRDSRDKSNKSDNKSSQKSGNNKTSNRGTSTNQNGLSPVGSLLGKRDSSSDRDNSHIEVGCKMSNISSNISIASNLSNLSITSSASGRSAKYLLDSTLTATPKPQPSTKELEAALNEENKAKSKIIHVRSKDFSDLMERFSSSKHNDGTGTALPVQKPHDVSGVKFRKRPKDKLKPDINRNGLIAREDCSIEDTENINTAQSPQQQNIVKTKCCSVV